MDSLLNRDLASALAEAGYRVALLDLLGHGRSEKPGRAQELRIDAFVEQGDAITRFCQGRRQIPVQQGIHQNAVH